MSKPLLFSITFCFLLLACEQEQTDSITMDETTASEPVDLVYPLLDAANSRWFFFNSATRPFGMVNLSPDTQVGGAWGSGYRYDTDTIKGFSHIHAWQLSGLSVMPLLYEKGIEQDYYSVFNHEQEIVEVGYHAVDLERYNIKAELTSTVRTGFHRYTYTDQANKAILFNLGGQLGPADMTNGSLQQEGDKVVYGQFENTPTRRRPKPVSIFFYAELSEAIQEVKEEADGKFFVFFATSSDEVVQMKVGLSYTSVENAKQNLQEELPHWDFEQVAAASKAEWNQLLGRIQIEGGSETDQRRFYTDLWHALQGRRIISDVNGAYPDYTGEKFRMGQLPLDENQKPKFNHYNSDSFWGAQWTINTLWGLVYPEIYESFVNSLLVYYQDGGLIPRGPSGGNYTNVMTGASSTPFIVSAYQKGIQGFNVDQAFAGMKKNHMPGGIMGRSGYEHSSAKGGGLEDYIKLGYVPHPNPSGNFGYHQDGASLTLEYAYQDWTLAQLAKALGREEDYQVFTKRSENYKNQFDPESGWMRPKDINGQWRNPFDPSEYEHGFNESNGKQSTWFVPHDIPGLATLMGGNEKAVEKLNEQFETAKAMNFTAGTSHERGENPERARVPINYGNQPSMQTAFIFNYLDRPDLTQYWSRAVTHGAFSGLSPHTGYNGDEDQGLMGALAVLLKIGLFQMTGGTEENPVYEICSPIFDKVRIELNQAYFPGDYFVMEMINNEKNNCYIKNAELNGQTLEGYMLRHQDIIKGGKLRLEMSENKK